LEISGVAETSNLPSKILVIDDDPAVGVGIEQALSKHKISVVKSTDLETALYQFNQNKFDVVIVELDFGPLPGLALIQKWRNHEIIDKRFTGFVVATSSQRTNGQDGLAREMSDIEIVTKPIKDIQLLPILARALANKQRLLAFHEVKERVINPHLKQGNVQKAIEKTQQMIGEVGEKAKRLLIEIYEGASQYQDCLDTTLKMLATNQNDIHLVSTAGRMQMKLGRFAEAKPFLEKADQLAPQNLDRLNALAAMYLQVKDPDKAVARFKELVKLNPESTDYKFDAFKQLYDHGFDEHAVAFGKEVAQPMEIVRHYNNKGVLLAKEGKITEALLEYERALKFYPKFKENFRIYYNLALGHMQLKTPDDLKKAQEYLKKALELDPTFEKAKASLANLQKLAP
jgi:tetratricopeptide (TPR) repeat protein